MDADGVDVRRGLGALGADAWPFKFFVARPIPPRMTVNSTAPSAATLEVEREVLVLKKQQDVAKQVGQALVELIQPPPAPGRIDTYA